MLPGCLILDRFLVLNNPFAIITLNLNVAQASSHLKVSLATASQLYNGRLRFKAINRNQASDPSSFIFCIHNISKFCAFVFIVTYSRRNPYSIFLPICETDSPTSGG
jgi:hypothetical protein